MQTNQKTVDGADQALNLSFLDDWEFIGGVGNYGKKQACVMSAAVAAVRVARGVDMNGATDILECVCPVVRKLLIARNDAMQDTAERKVWALSMIPRIVGTNHGKVLSVTRAEHIARYAIRVISAEAMDYAKLPEIAAQLRSIDDNTSMSDCRAVASAARDSVYKERDKRYDAAYADYTAYAAAAAAAYAAYADYTAYAAAAAAAYAADAADAAAAIAAYAAAAYAAVAAAAIAAAADAAAERLQIHLKHLDAMIEMVLAIRPSEESSSDQGAKR